jgi:hypothetical protein
MYSDFSISTIFMQQYLTKTFSKYLNSYFRYKCRKLSFIVRTCLKYDRGTREYFKGCECNSFEFNSKKIYSVMRTFTTKNYSKHYVQHTLHTPATTEHSNFSALITDTD